MNYKMLINKPKTKRGRETLNNIVSAAAQEIYEKGYHNAAISDITRRAGVASGTFYVYFASKDDLYKFLLLQCSHMIRKNLTTNTEHCKNRADVEEVGLREWLKFVQKNQYMYHIIWESLYVDKSLFEDYYTSFSKAYIRGIEGAKLRGEVAEDVDSEVLAWTLMGASNFLGLNWGLFSSHGSDNERVVQSFMRILKGNIFTDADIIPQKPEPANFRINVEFDDDDLEDEAESVGTDEPV